MFGYATPAQHAARRRMAARRDLRAWTLFALSIVFFPVTYVAVVLAALWERLVWRPLLSGPAARLERALRAPGTRAARRLGPVLRDRAWGELPGALVWAARLWLAARLWRGLGGEILTAPGRVRFAVKWVRVFYFVRPVEKVSRLNGKAYTVNQARFSLCTLGLAYERIPMEGMEADVMGPKLRFWTLLGPQVDYL